MRVVSYAAALTVLLAPLTVKAQPWPPSPYLFLNQQNTWGVQQNFSSGVAIGGVGVKGSAQNNTLNLGTGYLSAQGYNGQRPPTISDDSSAPLINGSSWGFGQLLFQLQNNAAGFAMWQQVQSSALPLDVIGLYVSGATVNAGGTNYVNGDTITIEGGVVLTVTNASGGVIQSGGISVTTPNMYGVCSPTTTGVPQLVTTSASGSGATFNLTILKPTGYGVRQLTKCYSGNAMTVTRSDNNQTKAIGFLSDGSLDTATLDGFVAATQPMTTYSTYNTAATPRVSVWNDQGGNANNATGVSGSWPTVFPNRKIGNSRSIVFDSHGQANAWDAPAAYLTIPGSVSASPNNAALAVLGGALTINFKPLSWINMGCITGGCYTFGITFNDFYSPAQVECDNGGITNVNVGVLPTDTPFLAVCQNTASGAVMDMLNATSSAGVGEGVSSVTGGYIGAAGNNQNSLGGLIDEAAVIIIPWSITSYTRLALEASMYQTFSVPPQYQAVIVTLGDSHMDGWGVPFQQSWPRQMMALLNRNNVALVNAGQAGAQLSNLVSNATFSAYVTPALTATNTPYKYVLLQGCYNDLANGQTVSQCEASYSTGIAETHAANAKAVCVTDVIRTNNGTGINANMQSIGNWIRSGAAGCDAVIDLQSYSVFNAASGPWNPPWFDSDQTHLTAAGNALVAEIAAKVMLPLLP